MAKIARKLLLHSQGKIVGGGGGGGGGVAPLSRSRAYGGAGWDEFDAVCEDANFVYAVGYTMSEGAGVADALIVKFNKATLTIAARKVYGGLSDIDGFLGVCEDANFVYAVGYTMSEGAGGVDALIVKFNKADLSIDRRKVYGGLSDDGFNAVCEDANFVYAVGYTDSEGVGGVDTLIVKFNKADLSIAARKVYGDAVGHDYFWGVCEDANFVYAVGYTTNALGWSDCLVVKFNKADLSIAVRRVYGGGAADSWFYGVCEDANFVYAVGGTMSEGAGDVDALIVKFNKADLSIDCRKVYGGGTYDEFVGVCEDASCVYAVGVTDSEGAGGLDGLIITFDKATLAGSGKVYGGLGNDRFYGVCEDANFLYVDGVTDGVGAGNDDCFIFKSTKTIPNGISVPPGFVCANSALTLADSALFINGPALVLADSALTLADSALVLADSALTLSVSYIIS